MKISLAKENSIQFYDYTTLIVSGFEPYFNSVRMKQLKYVCCGLNRLRFFI